MNGGKQRSLRIVDQEKGGKIINFDLPDESQTVRQFIAAYHWYAPSKSPFLFFPFYPPPLLRLLRSSCLFNFVLCVWHIQPK
jgi:hypothetical protein